MVTRRASLLTYFIISLRIQITLWKNIFWSSMLTRQTSLLTYFKMPLPIQIP